MLFHLTKQLKKKSNCSHEYPLPNSQEKTLKVLQCILGFGLLYTK